MRYFPYCKVTTMPTNADFLGWIHERLEHTHGENPNFDYMRKLRRLSEGQIGARTLQDETDDVPLGKWQKVWAWNNPPREGLEPQKFYARFRYTAGNGRHACEIGGSGRVQWFDHVEAFSDSEPARPSPHLYQSHVTIALAAQGDVTIQVPAGVGRITIGDDNG